jgi:hypothetical protein
MPHHRRGSW